MNEQTSRKVQAGPRAKEAQVIFLRLSRDEYEVLTLEQRMAYNQQLIAHNLKKIEETRQHLARMKFLQKPN